MHNDDYTTIIKTPQMKTCIYGKLRSLIRVLACFGVAVLTRPLFHIILSSSASQYRVCRIRIKTDKFVLAGGSVSPKTYLVIHKCPISPYMATCC